MSNYDLFSFKVERKVKGSRTFFFVTINDRRIGKTNFARKYDAMAQLRRVADTYTAEKLTDLLAA